MLGFNLGALSAERPDVVGAYLRRAVDLVASGEVTVHLAGRAPIRDAARVLKELGAGTTVGKTVLVHEDRVYTESATLLTPRTR